MKSFVQAVALVALTASCVACGGGGGSSDGTVIQGTLVERGGGHASAQAATLKHSAGEAIEEVRVCVLSTCSITDGQGQWGVNIDNFPGGDLTITVDGHGIDSQTEVSLPMTAKDVEVDLGHKSNTITVEKLMIDGEDHTGHDHDHSHNHS